MSYFNYNKLQFGFYIAGLIKDDGNIWTTKELKLSKGPLSKIRQIVLPSMHSSVLYKLGLKIKRELTEWLKVVSLKLIWS
jgi:hypothetical protein